MKDTINNATDFANRFKEIRPDNFSLAALETLFEFYEEMEDSTGGEMEFDPIAICCDWSEYEDVEEARRELDHVDGVTDCDTLEEVCEIVEDEAVAMMTRNNTLLVHAF